MKNVWAFLAIFTVIMLSSSVLYLSSEDFIISISEEDKPIENVNAALFLVSSLVAFYLYLVNPVHRKTLLLLSVVSMTGFLDELSFGARIFEIKMPMVMGTTFDAVHDLFYIGLKGIYKLTQFYPYLMLPLIIVGFLLITLLLIKYKTPFMIVAKRFYSNKPSFLLASFFTILLFLALVIDLDQIEHEFLFLVEELFELNSAIALFFLILSLQRRPVRKTFPETELVPAIPVSGIIPTAAGWQIRFIKRILKSPKALTRV